MKSAAIRWAIFHGQVIVHVNCALFLCFFKLKAWNKYVNYCKFNRLNLYFGYLKTKIYSENSFVIWHKLLKYQSFASTVHLQCCSC